MISPDVNCDVKQQEKKELVDSLYLVFFHKKYLQKLEIQCTKRHGFFI